MQLGAFSISLTVKDIDTSQAFYEKLGFAVMHGDKAQNRLIMKNSEHVIGLFQGMFEQNILTFNPGRDQDATALATFTDIRDLQKDLKAKGIAIDPEIDPTTTGPASCMLTDPDGNTILLDQHV